MARVLALVPDLLFGSRVQADLSAGGHEVTLIGDEQRLRERLHDADAAHAQVLVVDLTDAQLQGAALVESLREAGSLAGVATLGFYSHVDAAAKERAQAAGFDLVVPRSRMAREGALLAAQVGARSS